MSEQIFGSQSEAEAFVRSLVATFDGLDANSDELDPLLRGLILRREPRWDGRDDVVEFIPGLPRATWVIRTDDLKIVEAVGATLAAVLTFGATSTLPPAAAFAALVVSLIQAGRKVGRISPEEAGVLTTLAWKPMTKEELRKMLNAKREPDAFISDDAVGQLLERLSKKRLRNGDVEALVKEDGEKLWAPVPQMRL